MMNGNPAMSSRIKRAAVATAAAIALCAVGTTAPNKASAAPLNPIDVTFASGQVCTFPLRVEGTGANQVTHTFGDRNGDTTTISAGTGFALTFTNLDNNAQFKLPARFSATTTVTHPDGSKTVQLTGWNILFLFPTDTPADPSTTLYIGVVVYEDDGLSNFTLDQRRTHSKTLDICAAID